MLRHGAVLLLGVNLLSIDQGLRCRNRMQTVMFCAERGTLEVTHPIALSLCGFVWRGWGVPF